MDISKRVTDPVHGSIPLSPVEVAVMDTQVFQRLRRVKQLGLAHFVFPSADYSRLAHSLGVCHTTGLTIQALADSGADISEHDKQVYRLAGLLHDVGHYPLSHCTEHALKEYYDEKRSASQLQPRGSSASPSVETSSELLESYKHEQVSELLVKSDPQLSAVLKKYGYDPDDLASIFIPRAKFPFDKLVSSDLDADRIDYLLRSARATGLPYGNVDINYLLSQICLDDNKQVCIHPKGLRAAEHFLLCRYFDYQQIVFHKSVVGFECIARQIIKVLLDKEQLDWSKAKLNSAVTDLDWLSWDDDYLMQLIKGLADDEKANVIDRLKAKSLWDRTSPKLVIDLEEITDTGKSPLREHIKAVADDFHVRAEKIGIGPDQCFEWTYDTSVGIAVPTQEEEEKSLRVLKVKSGKRESEPIVDRKYSVMSVLGKNRLYMYRMYVVPKDADQRQRATELSNFLRDNYHYFSWK